jgi:hypothetical protein
MEMKVEDKSKFFDALISLMQWETLWLDLAIFTGEFNETFDYFISTTTKVVLSFSFAMQTANLIICGRRGSHWWIKSMEMYLCFYPGMSKNYEVEAFQEIVWFYCNLYMLTCDIWIKYIRKIKNFN